MLREPALELLDVESKPDGDPDGFLAAAATASLKESEYSDSAMVALYPDAATAAAVALDGGDEPDQLHVTLAFLGKIKKLSREDALEAVREWAAGCPPLKGEISGVGHFVGGPDPVTYLSIDLPELPHQREALVEQLEEAGTPAARDHGFTPHMTLDYAARRPKVEKPIPLTFTHVTLSWGDEQLAVPLTGKELKESLVAHAQTELEKAGLFDKDSDYDGMLGNEILRIVRTFSEGGHSGGSAAMTIAALEKLLRFEPLTPLTSDPEEWTEVTEYMVPPDADERVWQSKRQPGAFSRDGGKSWEIMEAATLLEGKWNPSLHPRWPKGTPRAGEFMQVGQRFIGADGKEWQIAHIVKGKVITHRAEGKLKDTETGVFHPKKVAGEKSPVEGETFVIEDAKKEAAPRLVKGGKAKTANVTTVDAYVDPTTHDASIPVPANSKISETEWQRFGEIDQEHYSELMERFGKYSPAKAKTLIDESYQDYEAEVQAIVKNAYAEQYGSSTGFSLSLAGIFKHLTGQDKKDLEKLDAQRQRALELQGRHKDVIAWDLYNRTRSPDIAVFHKSSDPPAYWQEFIAGNRPVMSGLSQSFNFGANFQFGNNTLATPLAIRNVLMSSYSAQPIPGQSHFPGELEVSTAEQLKIDNRSITFSLHEITANQKKWLMGVTKAPAGGAVIERFQEALQSGEMLPTPPAPADIQMGGQGQKLWIDPPPEAAEFAKSFDAKLPKQQGAALNPADLDKEGPWAFKDSAGNPMATVAKESELKPGDYMMGLKGTLYLLIEDPGDPTGFGLRYMKLENGAFTDESYNFEGGGTNQYFKLDKHFELPDPHKEQKATDLFDPHAWVNGDKEEFVGKLEPGEKFKVNGNPYEVVAQLNGAQTQIKDLASDKVGTINTDYKTPVLVPKDGYVPSADDYSSKLTPTKGMTFAYDGKKHTITNVLKDGTVKAKPSGGGKTIAVAGDDAALDDLYDPSAYKIGAKVQAGDLSVGALFHGGRGSTHRPYIVTGTQGNKVMWRSLDTGEEGVFTQAKVVRHLDAVEPVSEPEPEAPAPAQTGGASGFDSEAWVPNGGSKVGKLAVGDKFTWEGDPYEVKEFHGPSSSVASENLVVGAVKTFPEETPVTKLIAKNQPPASASASFKPDEWVPVAEMPVSDLPFGSVVSHSNQTYELTGRDKSGNIEAVSVEGVPGTWAFPNDVEVTHLLPKGEVDATVASLTGDEALKKGMKPGTMVGLGALSPGDFFEVDGEHFVVTEEAPTLEDNVGVAPILPSGVIGMKTTAGSFPDKVVTYKGTNLDPASFAQTQAPSSEGLPDLEMEGGFVPYKSKYGSGGKYTHDKLADMQVGTVFQDKKGQLWKVKANDHSLIVTNGVDLFQASPDLRGKVTQAEFVDQTTPLPSPQTTASEADAASGLVDNWPNLKLGELPEGSQVLINGKVQTIEGSPSGDYVLTAFPNGGSDVVLKSTIPDKISPAAKPPMTIGSLEPGEEFASGITMYEVVAHSSNGTVVKSKPTGVLLQLPPNTPWEKVDYLEPSVPAPKAQTLGQLSDGEVFEGAGGVIHKVVAHADHGGVVVMVGDKPGGAMNQIPPDTFLEQIDATQKDGLSPFATGALETAVPSTPWTPEVQHQLNLADAEMEDVPTLDLLGFKSKWGSGGKYQHHRIEELEPGAVFTDKTGTAYTYLGPGPPGLALVRDGESSLHLVALDTRVKQGG